MCMCVKCQERILLGASLIGLVDFLTSLPSSHEKPEVLGPGL